MSSIGGPSPSIAASPVTSKPPFLGAQSPLAFVPKSDRTARLDRSPFLYVVVVAPSPEKGHSKQHSNSHLAKPLLA